MLDIDKIYITHHKPLIERKDFLLKKFNDLNITNIEWVENFLPNEIEDLHKRILAEYTFNENNTNIVYDICFHMNYYGKTDFIYPENTGKHITITELSLYLKHKYALEEQIKNNYNHILILEDDVCLPIGFINYFNISMNEFKNSNSDILVMGKSHNFTSRHIQPGKFIHFGKNQLTRCAHCIIYKLDATKKILKHLDYINFQWDFKLNEIFIKENMNIAWSEPGIIQNRYYNSTIIK
jgi:GR25 family glycosyltransferase involved in LPS biosynthesis